ncbi:hypothetical protein VTL71DRAFT_2931 [Oculimacula yallundae]|uniref:Uncharacterized protein n=1 Tax=Oculimacula yallundae TaxID=86028 RepID=A0ABR4C6I8_9HELO
MSSPPHEHNLGVFATLPAEIRAEIWKGLRSNSSPSFVTQKRDGKDGLGILRACRQLYHEIMPHLYDDTLEFHVWSYGSLWLTIKNTQGARWEMHGIPLRDELYDKFSNLPYQNLKRLKITITAPETGDKAQLLGLSRNVRDLVRLLEKATGLPSLEIHLLDSKHPAPVGKWAQEDGTPTATVALRTAADNISSDDMIALLPFCRLRNIPHVSVKVPADLIRDEGTWKRMEDVLMRIRPFGTVVGEESFWDDNNIQEMLDDIYIDLEEVLDQAPGQDLNMMRLRRFANWYAEDGTSEYVEEWERMGREPHGHAADELYTFDIGPRHDYMLTLNPLSASMQKIRLQLDVPIPLRQADFPLAIAWDMDACLAFFRMLEYEDVNSDIYRLDVDGEVWPETALREEAIPKLRTCWSRVAWLEYHPLGIPPLAEDTSAEYAKYSSASAEIDEVDRWYIPFFPRGWRTKFPSALERVSMQKTLINFKSGDRIREERFISTTGEWFNLDFGTIPLALYSLEPNIHVLRVSLELYPEVVHVHCKTVGEDAFGYMSAGFMVLCGLLKRIDQLRVLEGYHPGGYGEGKVVAVGEWGANQANFRCTCLDIGLTGEKYDMDLRAQMSGNHEVWLLPINRRAIMALGLTEKEPGSDLRTFRRLGTIFNWSSPYSYDPRLLGFFDAIEMQEFVVI